MQCYILMCKIFSSSNCLTHLCVAVDVHGDAAGRSDAACTAPGRSLCLLREGWAPAGSRCVFACKSQWVLQHSVQEASCVIDWDAHHQRPRYHPPLLLLLPLFSLPALALGAHVPFAVLHFFSQTLKHSCKNCIDGL